MMTAFDAGLLMLLAFVIGLLFGLTLCYTRLRRPARITRTRRRTRRSIK